MLASGTVTSARTSPQRLRDRRRVPVRSRDIHVAPNLEIAGSDYHGSVRLRVTGELDGASAPILRDRLAQLRANGLAVQLDLSQLEFVDLSGLDVILDALHEADSNGWDLRIAPHASREVLRLFRLVKLDRLILGAHGATR